MYVPVIRSPSGVARMNCFVNYLIVQLRLLRQSLGMEIICFHSSGRLLSVSTSNVVLHCLGRAKTSCTGKEVHDCHMIACSGSTLLDAWTQMQAYNSSILFSLGPSPSFSPSSQMCGQQVDGTSRGRGEKWVLGGVSGTGREISERTRGDRRVGTYIPLSSLLPSQNVRYCSSCWRNCEGVHFTWVNL